MKKTIILLALAVMLLLAGCDDISARVEDIRPTPSEDVAANGQVGANGEEAPATPSPEPDETVPALTEADFSIEAEGITIAIGADPAAVFDTLGDGGVNEDNNFGFIGWDPNEEYKFFRHDYEGFSVIVKTHAAEGTSAISQIGLTGIATGRGIAPGDSYDDMLAQYGEPDEEKSDEGMTDCTYVSGERTIIFVLNEADRIISYIQMY